MRKSNAQDPLPFRLTPAEMGPGTLDPEPPLHLPLWRKHPSPLLGPRDGHAVCSLWVGHSPPALGPGRCAPLPLTKPLSSFSQSSGTYWLLSQCQARGIAATLSSFWSPLIRQSHLAHGPTPDPLSVYWPISCGTFMQLSFLSPCLRSNSLLQQARCLFCSQLRF